MGHVLVFLYLAAASLFFLLIGAFATLKPRAFAASLDLEPQRRGGCNEVRAQYGGLFVAIGATGGLALFGILDRPFALGVVGLVFGGVAAGRLLGVALDHGVDGYGATVKALVLIDTAGCSLAIAALLTERGAG